MQTTYQNLINNTTNNIYFSIERHFSYCEHRGKFFNLDKPLLFLEYHYNKYKGLYETKNDIIWNTEFTKNIHGIFYCNENDQIKLFEKYGWKIKLVSANYQFTNTCTNHTWNSNLYLIEN